MVQLDSNPGTNKPPDLSFKQAYEWAKEDSKERREKNTWTDKYMYIIGGIIVLVIIFILIYIYYYGADKTEESVILDSLDDPETTIPAKAATTPRVHYSSKTPTYTPYTPKDLPGGGSIVSPGGTMHPAIGGDGVQTGWWYNPPFTQ